MKYCIKCGAQLPDEALFCNVCGTPQPSLKQGSAQNVVSINESEKSKILTEMKCPNCGAALNPMQGEAMVVCQYCGTSISLSSAGWTNVQKHYILDIKVALQDQALAIARTFLDKSIFHKHLFEKSTIQKVTLSYVPYWIIVAGYTSQYQYQKQVSAQYGRYNSIQTINESGTDTGTVSYPIVAVENLNAYQPPDYIFNLTAKREITPKDMSNSVKLLNGDIGEEKARVEGKIRIQEWEMRKLKKKYHTLQSTQTNIDIAEIYLVHIPVWNIEFKHKDQKMVLLIDGHNAMVMEELKDKEV